jgi:2-aminoadipate transaminase
MRETYSKRISGVKASAIRDILKMMADSEMISFGGGNPASDSFPIDELVEISNEILTSNPLSVLEYGVTEGVALLKEEVIKFVNKNEKVVKENDDILVTSGSQQIMDFIAKVLCNEDDLIICENPSFLGALNAFKSNGAKLIGIPMEADGMNLEALEESLQLKPKFIYTIPNFQNPTGITTSYAKRKKIYELAKKYEVIIVEDNPYGNLRYRGESIPSIKSFDTENIVIYAFSLSKIIAPGMRVAAMIGNQGIVEKCILAKQVNDVHTNAWAQHVMARFLNQTDMDKHLEKLTLIYKHKSSLMLDSIKKNFSPKVSYTVPEGGMFIWVTLPQHVNMVEFVKEAMKLKVAVVPGNAFYVEENSISNSFRMNFSTPSDEDIITGCHILGDLTKKYC